MDAYIKVSPHTSVLEGSVTATEEQSRGEGQID